MCISTWLQMGKVINYRLKDLNRAVCCRKPRTKCQMNTDSASVILEVIHRRIQWGSSCNLRLALVVILKLGGHLVSINNHSPSHTTNLLLPILHSSQFYRPILGFISLPDRLSCLGGMDRQPPIIRCFSILELIKETHRDSKAL